MLPSIYTLDHHISELRQVGDELRLAREARDSAEAAVRPARSIGQTVRGWLAGSPAASRPSRRATR
jgi:hypothetical protein